jgi:tetratricopeptide (TPR) repeat protein
MKMYKLMLISICSLSIGTQVIAGGKTPSLEEFEAAVSKPGPGGRASKLYNQGYELVQKLKAQEEDGSITGHAVALNYRRALSIFKDAIAREPKDPDILNMLAYSQRKTGDYESAIGNYKKALAERPVFPEAREYLGEAYLQLALQQVKQLKSYGEQAEHELEDLTASIKNAAESL